MTGRFIASCLLAGAGLLPAWAAAAELGAPLMDLAAEMQPDARAVVTLTARKPSEGAVVRRYARPDGVQFFTVLPPFKQQATVAGITQVDRFAQSAFARLNARVPGQRGPKFRFQGFRAFQYTDGTTGITYAALVPQVRITGEKLVGQKSQFCDAITAPSPPRAFPRNEIDTYVESGVDPDSNGAWYRYEFRFEAFACPAGSCGTSTPTGYVWTMDQQCGVVDPQPNPTPPEPPVPPVSGNGGVVDPWDIHPVLIPGNAGFAWTFSCSYGGVPVDCYTG